MKNTSHYNVQPTPYKMRMSKNLYIKNEKDFYKSIFQLINKGKNDYCTYDRKKR